MLAILITGIGGVVVSLIGGDLLTSTLIIQLQLWRATWLLHLASYPALVLLFLRPQEQQRSTHAVVFSRETTLLVAMRTPSESCRQPNQSRVT